MLFRKVLPFTTTNFNLHFLHFFNKLSWNLGYRVYDLINRSDTLTSGRSVRMVSFKVNLFATTFENTMLPLIFSSTLSYCFHEWNKERRSLERPAIERSIRNLRQVLPSDRDFPEGAAQSVQKLLCSVYIARTPPL